VQFFLNLWGVFKKLYFYLKDGTVLKSKITKLDTPWVETALILAPVEKFSEAIVFVGYWRRVNMEFSFSLFY
jgi:hypothetical protein